MMLIFIKLISMISSQLYISPPFDPFKSFYGFSEHYSYLDNYSGLPFYKKNAHLVISLI